MPEIQKVRDPAKIVTDPVVLEFCAKHNIDKDYVEFWHDYAPRSKGKEYGPTAKWYRDLKSGQHIGVFSGLPMVKALGHKIEVGWLWAKGKYYSKANLFSAIVEGKQVRLTCLSDQPTGVKKGDQAIWEPQLFLNGVEQTCGKAVLLETDPINENYHQNVLEWDYGICKRRIRIIEGRFRERWLFESNPHSDVRIKHNFNGNLELKLGYAHDAEGKELQVIVTRDEEIVEASEFGKAIYPDKVIYPVEIGASMTFYPDAHVETSTVDGLAGRYMTNETWPDITGNAGNHHFDDVDWMTVAFIQTNTVQDRWWNNRRAFALFDATSLPPAAVIDLAELDFYGRLAADGGHKTDGLNINPNVNIYASTPASNIDLVNADYQEFINEPPLCTGPISYTFWSEGYNVFALNSAGRAAISKTLISKFGTQNTNYDVYQIAPNWSASQISYLCAYPAEKGSGYKPKLVVTYHLIIEGSASGEGVGLASTQGILDVLGQPIGSGIGLATSEAKLDVIAQALGNGIGLSTASSYLIIPGLASGQGVGLAEAVGCLLFEGTASGSGVGLGITEALIRVLAEAQGSGSGLGSTVPYLIIPASAYGSGDGEGLAEAILTVLAQAEASGIGIGTASGYVLIIVEGIGAGSGIGLGLAEGIRAVVGIASASGIGVGTSQALLDVLALISGHGIGIGATPGATRIILRIVKPPAVHDLGKTKPHYTLGKPQVDYTLGKAKAGSHNLSRKVERCL